MSDKDAAILAALQSINITLRTVITAIEQLQESTERIEQKLQEMTDASDR